MKNTGDIMKRILSNFIQLVLPAILLMHFKQYIHFKECVQYYNLSIFQLGLYVLIYIIIVIMCIYLVICTHQGNTNFICLLLGWIEAVIVYVFPLTHFVTNDALIFIKMHPIEFIEIYGSIVILYSFQLIWMIHIKRLK